MNNLDKNWNNLFGEYTGDETAWHGQWTTHSPNQEVINSKQAIRGFRSNLDNTVITHINRYLDADGNVVDEKNWQIDRETCNQPDGVIHPAMSSMRALSLGAGATAWTSQKLIPGKPFGVELFFRDDNWRTSAAIIYGENGQLNRIVQIREHLSCFSDQSPSLGTSDISGNWIGKKRSLTSNLSVSPEENTQISFDKLSGQHKMISLPGGMILMLPEIVTVDRPIQLAAGQRTADEQLKYLTAHYSADGQFTLLIFATLQQQT
ncbi:MULTISPECIES: DUF3598 family protein [unclassified Microcoleus]|uniref:DUF3598 family protein n=1 Tax=unclassified Microcoleus TaxID=2642155 RepID=UPI002FD56FFF